VRRKKNSDQPRQAIAVVHVDGSVTDQVLAKLRTIPAVQAGESGPVVLVFFGGYAGRYNGSA